MQYLKGIKVVELASVLAGPSVGMFLAELGAEVIKIENPKTKGDVTRTWKLSTEDATSNVSAYFSSVNWGKQYQFVDISTEQGQHEVLSLIDDADIVLSNFKAGDAARYGLDEKTLRATRPKLIYAHISGFGDNDPRPAFDVVLQAEAGFMHMNGTPQSGPVKMPVALIDVLAAHQLKEGILLALLQRERTDKGCYVSVSLYDAAVSSLVNQATNYLMAGHIPKRIGSEHPNIAPYGDKLSCKDGAIVLAVGSQKQFEALCSVLGVPELTEAPWFKDNAERVKNRKELMEQLQQAIGDRSRDELMEQLLAANVPAGAIRNMAEVMNDPRSQALLLKEHIDGIDTTRVAGKVFKIRP